MRKHAITIVAAMALLTLFAGHSNPVRAQYQDAEAAEILELARQHYEESIRNIDDYVIEYEHYSQSYVKRYDNGRPYMVAYDEREFDEGLEAASGAGDTDLFAPEMFDKMKERARYLGTEEVDGYQTHVIFIDELEGFIEEDEEMGETAQELKMYLDSDNFLLRKMEFKVEALVEEEIRVVEPVIYFRDYREIEGMPIAFETKTIVSGISDMMTEEEREEMEEAFAEMERELEQMPEAQRQMVEQMMAGQMEEMKEMLEADQWEHVTRVKDVRVNVGLE